MNINKHIFILTLLAAGSISAGAKILEMDNDQLDEEFRGSGGGIYGEDLAKELNTPNGPALIRKFLADERLKMPLYVQISHIKDEAVRDGLLVKCLRDPAVWAMEYDGLRNKRGMWASVVSECVSKRFPAVGSDKEQYIALVYTFMTPQGREAVAGVYQKFLEAPAGQSGETETRKARLLDGIKEAMAKYGTKKFVYPPEPGLPPEANQPFPFGVVSSKKAAAPAPSPPVVKEKAAAPASPGWSWPPWAVGCVAALVAACLLFLVRLRKCRNGINLRLI